MTPVFWGVFFTTIKWTSDNKLKKFLEGQGFTEVVREATHIDGGHLDHAYVLNRGGLIEDTVVQLVPKYYSDHDAVCIILKLNIEPDMEVD